MPLQRRLPKRGFNNIFATKYVTIKVSDLEKFEAGATVDAQALQMCIRDSGKGGAESAKIEKQLAKLTGKNVNLNIVEVKGTTTNAQLEMCIRDRRNILYL